MYYANLSVHGPVKYQNVFGSIGVLESPDNHLLVGKASCQGRDENGLAVWTLKVRGKELLGRWVIIDRVFRPA